MDAARIVKGLSLLVSLAGFLVVLGWIFSIPTLKSILPFWPAMHLSTGICFLLSGIAIYFISESQRGKKEVSAVILPVVSPLILLAMAFLLLVEIFYAGSALEDLFVQDVVGATAAGVAGFPPVGSVVGFILIAVMGAFALYEPQSIRRNLFLSGLVVSFAGGLALVGHFFNLPFLYYALFGWSSAMPLQSSLLFLGLGTSMVLVRDVKPELAYFEDEG